MITWIYDNNGNRASVERWGSEDAARASLATLRNCMDCTLCTLCTRCTGCMGCMDCTRCKGCTRCTDCMDCTRCTGCMDCNMTLPNVRMPVSDPRGYAWLAIWEKDEWRIHAGCRNFTIEEARAHWMSPDYDGPDTVRETVPMALDWLVSR